MSIPSIYPSVAKWRPLNVVMAKSQRELSALRCVNTTKTAAPLYPQSLKVGYLGNKSARVSQTSQSVATEGPKIRMGHNVDSKLRERIWSEKMWVTVNRSRRSDTEMGRSGS